LGPQILIIKDINMSVITNADDAIRKAKENLRDAKRQLQIFTDEDTWGYDEYNIEYIEKVRKLIRRLEKFLDGKPY